MEYSANLTAEETRGAEGEELVTVPRAMLEALRGQNPGGFSGGPVTADDGQIPRREEPPAWFEKELETRDRRLAELEGGLKSAVRDRELLKALSGKPLVPGAASQLLKLWRDDIDAYEDGGDLKVVAKDGRPVADAVNDWLKSAEFSHFSLPGSRGGAGPKGVNQPGPGPAVSQPRNLGEAVVSHWREESAARRDQANRPIGLKGQR